MKDKEEIPAELTKECEEKEHVDLEIYTLNQNIKIWNEKQSQNYYRFIDVGI